MGRGNSLVESVTAADGTEIAYERSGAGPPLVLVHGTAGDHSGWREVAPVLAETFTVYAMDRRGRGESGNATERSSGGQPDASGDADEYAIEREYADVVAVVERAAAEAGPDDPVSLLGHSYGAICALHAVLETDAVDRLLLYEPPLADAPAPEGLAEEIEATIATEGNEAGLVQFLAGAVDMTESEIELMRGDDLWAARVAAAPTIPREIRATQRGLFDPDRFEDVSVPATLFVGAESGDRMADATDRVADALAGSRVVPLEGREHIAMHTAPDRFVDAVTDALR